MKNAAYRTCIYVFKGKHRLVTQVSKEALVA